MTGHHSGPTLAERDGLTVIACHACGFAHLTEPPAGEGFYQSEFWQAYKPGALERMQAQAEWWAATYGDWLSLAEQNTLGRTLLDVGAGYGQFVRAARERGWAATGIESSIAAAAWAREQGAWVLTGSWETTPLERYDCISTLWLVEHLPDAERFLRWARAHLYGGGVLLAVVPNEWTREQAQANRIAERKFYWLDKTHYSYFDWPTFANLLGRCGFRIVERLATWPMERFIVDGDDYTDDADLGAACHREVEQHDLRLTRAERLAFYGELAGHGDGRDMVVVAKPE